MNPAKSNQPNDQTDMIKGVDRIGIAYQNEKRTGEQNHPKSLDLKEDEKSEICLFSHVFPKIRIACILGFTAASLKQVGTQTNGPGQEQCFE